VILSSGLKPGDQVVVDGQEKLKNGSKVVPRQAAATGAAELDAADEAAGRRS